MNFRVATKSVSPQLRTGRRAIIENISQYEHIPGEPIGLLMALTYAEYLIPVWTESVIDVAPHWGFNSSLSSPQWAK